MKLPARYFGPANGRHRKDAPERITVPLKGLHDRSSPQPPRPYGAVAPQRWADCPECGVATAGVLTKDGHTCGQCLTTTPTATALEARR